MDLELVYNDLKMNQKVFEKEYCFKLSQDIIVSDNKPDILEILHRNSNIYIDRCEMLDNGLKLNGVVSAEAIYMADNEKSDIRSICTEIEVNEMLDCDVRGEDIFIKVKPLIENVNCKMINERKVSMEIETRCIVELYKNKDISYIENLRKSADIQVLENNIEASKLNFLQREGINLTEEVSVSSLDIIEILETNVRIINEEYKLSYNKILVKADVLTNVLYVTQTNEIVSQEIILPLTGFVDVNNINEKNNIDVQYYIKNKSISLNKSTDDAKFNINVDVGVDINSTENIQLSVINDMYGLNSTLVFDNNCIKNEVVICQENIIHLIKQMVELEDTSCKVCNVNYWIIKNEAHKINDKLHIEGELLIEILCKNCNKIIAKSVTVPYNHVYENCNMKNVDEFCVRANVQNVKYMVIDNKIDFSGEIKFNIKLIKQVEIDIIDNIRQTEERATCPYSITIYYVKPNDTLWKIAKQFATTVEEIAKYNEIENPDKYMLMPGKQLFIPKKVLQKVV